MLKTYHGRHPLQNYFAIRENPIAFLSNVLKECGDFALIRIFAFRFYLINDPNIIRETLIEKNNVLVIEGGVSRGLARLIGNGILTNHGDQWRQSRHNLQPLFRQEALESYFSIVTERVQESLN